MPILSKITCFLVELGSKFAFFCRLVKWWQPPRFEHWQGVSGLRYSVKRALSLIWSTFSTPQMSFSSRGRTAVLLMEQNWEWIPWQNLNFRIYGHLNTSAIWFDGLDWYIFRMGNVDFAFLVSFTSKFGVSYQLW